MEKSTLRRVEPVRIFEQAVEQIRSLIANGTWTPGDKLPTEQELGRQFNVSRSSVREALRVLESEGLIEARRGSGTYVVDSPAPGRSSRELAQWLVQREETLEQVLQVRERIEGLTASLAATLASGEDLAQIRAIVEEQARKIEEQGCEGDACVEMLARLDAAFHLAISSASGNDFAHEIISHVIPAFNASNKAVLYLRQRADTMEQEHREILAALEAHDPAAAEQAMHRHILKVRAEIMAIE
ncbi:MAG TPA: FadR/GntR family transcriptional regulator [Anaerolineales bacterium]